MYVVLSPVAKSAAAVAGVGVVLVAWHKFFGGGDWADIVGSVLFFGGVLVYFVERIRLSRRARSDDDAAAGR
jgi:drug/metabolite transporter (DMT)-like permease